jgi:hypothetical protein
MRLIGLVPILSLTVNLVVAPLPAGAQPVGKVYRIGVLDTLPVAQNAANLDAFRQGMGETRLHRRAEFRDRVPIAPQPWQ